MKYITFKGKDGSVAIMSLVDGADQDETVKKFYDSHSDGFYLLQQVSDKLPAIPGNRLFRDAWTLGSTGKIEIDKKKAEDIHMERIRASRNAKLKELDIETMKNISNPDPAIEAEKQRLRDLPKTFKLDKLNTKYPELCWPTGIDNIYYR